MQPATNLNTIRRMKTGMSELPDQFTEFATFDLRTNVVNRRVSNIMHFVSTIFFVPLFAGVTAAVRPGTPFDPVDLWSASIPGLGALGSLAVVFLLVVGVLYFHGLVHWGAFRVLGGASPTFSTQGITFSVSAPEWVLNKRTTFGVTVLPFFVVSALGAVLLSIVPSSGIAWVYLPVVANGVASARDILTLSWLLVTPKGCLFTHAGEVLTAYAPPGTEPLSPDKN